MFQDKTDEKTKRIRKEIHGKFWILDIIQHFLIIILSAIGVGFLIGGLIIFNVVMGAAGYVFVLFAMVTKASIDTQANRRILNYLVKKEK